MKTTIENKAEPVAPETDFPALYQYISEGGLKTIALATSERSGFIIGTEDPRSRVGHEYTEKCNKWAESAFTRITTPITVTFDPTK